MTDVAEMGKDMALVAGLCRLNECTNSTRSIPQLHAHFHASTSIDLPTKHTNDDKVELHGNSTSLP